jgi:lycopene cyclase domain-containing protein
MEQFTYLVINLFTLLPGIVLGFDKKVHYFTSWRTLIKSILLVAIFFIVWDLLFTLKGVWTFNNRYLTGVYIYNLPIEEMLFFFTVPFASMFIYRTYSSYILRNYFNGNFLRICFIIFGITCSIFSLTTTRAYTSVVLTTTSIVSLLLSFQKEKLESFLITYCIHLLPFLIVNGILTSLPVVLYNENEITGIRVYTIPIEDFFYALVLFGGNVLCFNITRNKPQE